MTSRLNLSWKSLLSIVVLSKALYASEEFLRLQYSEIKIHECEIATLPEGIKSVRIQFPGIDENSNIAIESIHASNHNEAHISPTPVDYIINGDSIYISDLTTDTGKRKLDTAKLNYQVQKTGKNQNRTYAKENIFADLFANPCQSGDYVMMLQFTDKPVGVTVTFKPTH